MDFKKYMSNFDNEIPHTQNQKLIEKVNETKYASHKILKDDDQNNMLQCKAFFSATSNDDQLIR